MQECRSYHISRGQPRDLTLGRVDMQPPAVLQDFWGTEKGRKKGDQKTPSFQKGPKEDFGKTTSDKLDVYPQKTLSSRSWWMEAYQPGGGILTASMGAALGPSAHPLQMPKELGGLPGTSMTQVNLWGRNCQG